MKQENIKESWNDQLKDHCSVHLSYPINHFLKLPKLVIPKRFGNINIFGN